MERFRIALSCQIFPKVYEIWFSGESNRLFAQSLQLVLLPLRPFLHDVQRFGYGMDSRVPVVLLAIVLFLNQLDVELLEAADGRKLSSPSCSMR